MAALAALPVRYHCLCPADEADSLRYVNSSSVLCRHIDQSHTLPCLMLLFAKGVVWTYQRPTLKETRSFSCLQLPPVYSSYAAAERLLLSSLAPLPTPHQSLPGGAASTTPPADFQTSENPLQVANPQLPPCIWLAELRLVPPFRRPGLVLPWEGLINPHFTAPCVVDTPPSTPLPPPNSLLAEGEADIHPRGLRHRLLSCTWLSRTRGLPRLQSPRCAAGAHAPRFRFTPLSRSELRGLPVTQ